MIFMNKNLPENHNINEMQYDTGSLSDRNFTLQLYIIG
jgi:hypothetical protein